MFLHLGQDTVIIDDEIIGIFDLDTTTVSKPTRDYLKTMQKSGNVVNVSSIASTVVSTNTGAYSASKGAVTQFTKYAALEMAAYGIRVNAVGPGPHVTRITEGTRFDPVRCEKFLSNIPMGRFGEPEEAAAAALFLGSDDASYITGTTLLEDGGFTLF